MGYILYIDESYSERDKFIVMAGFVIPLSKWKSLDNGVNQLKDKYFSNPTMNLKSIRRSRYDDHKLWEKLGKEEKDKFNKEFYGLIVDSENLILAALIDKSKMNNKTKKLFFTLAYSFLIQRYQYFLSEKNSYGCVVMDFADSNDEIRDLYETHKTLLSMGIPVKRDDIIFKVGKIEVPIKGYKRTAAKNICENLIFFEDKDNNLLQIVDMIAAAISGKFNRSIDVWFEKIKPIIRNNGSGRIEGYGIKIFPL